MSETEKLVRLWIDKADHDLGTATLTHSHIPAYKDTICFHCQQAIEKYLKAYLVFLGVEFRPVHDLIYLLDLASGSERFGSEFFDMASKVDGYAVQIRYPDKVIEPSAEEVSSSIEYAKKFREAILVKMNFSR
ncbi:MAG: HEPN domain-containing protein [Ignavibacteriae bacterium]|nr:HEPN domain-containing protein [Ignavibacteriota bacterium]